MAHTGDGLEWASFALSRSIDQPLTVTPPASSLHLHPSKFTLSPSLFLSPTSPTTDATLVLIHESHALLAGISSGELLLSLWDLQYQVLLASRSMPLPSSTRSSAPLLHAISVDDHQALILITHSMPSGTKKNTSDSPSSLIMVPFTVPPTSSILNAIATGQPAGGWLKAEESVVDMMSPSERAIIAQIKADSSKANEILTKYQKETKSVSAVSVHNPLS